MTILEELLQKIEKSDLDEKLKIICDQIMEEELIKSEYKEFPAPKGPNIFMAIYFNDKQNYSNFLCLEREAKEEYIVSLWVEKRNLVLNPNLKRIKVWPVNETNPEKILTFFAKTLKYVRGEI